MKTTIIISILFASNFLSGCKFFNSDLNSENTYQGKKVNYNYQVFQLSHNEKEDTFQKYAVENGLLSKDDSEKMLPRELQGLFYLEGAPFPDKALSFKEAKLIEGGKILWTVPNKSTFAWLNTPKGHKTYAAAKSHKMQYELEWKDCTDEVVSDMTKQFELHNINEAPKKCSASDRKFAVIKAFAWIDGTRIKVPDNILYFDMYLIPSDGKRDYNIWHRRSRLCPKNDNAALNQFCSIVKKMLGSSKNTDGYSRYQFTQVLTPEGKRTAKYTGSLVPDVYSAAGKEKNIFYICDTTDVKEDPCQLRNEPLEAFQGIEETISSDNKNKSIFEKMIESKIY